MRGLRAYALSTVLRMGTRRGFEKDGFRWKALEMIAMQSYNRFWRLRVQKIRLTFVNAGKGWG